MDILFVYVCIDNNCKLPVKVFDNLEDAEKWESEDILNRWVMPMKVE